MFKRIGLIGLGNMGRGMALTLKRQGFEVVGTDVAITKREACPRRAFQITDCP